MERKKGEKRREKRGLREKKRGNIIPIKKSTSTSPPIFPGAISYIFPQIPTLKEADFIHLDGILGTDLEHLARENEELIP